MQGNRQYYLILLLLLGAVLLGFFLDRSNLLRNPTDPGAEMKDKQKKIIVMLGDSITFRTDWNTLLDRTDVINRGINGDSVRDFLGRLDPILMLKPKICFVMGGINDIAQGYGVENIYRDYVLVLKKLGTGGINPVVQSTLRVESGSFESPEINRKVNALNLKLKLYCLANDIDFLDLNQTMSRDGGLIPAYTDDGVHLSKKGYQEWGKMLRAFLRKINFKSKEKNV